MRISFFRSANFRRAGYLGPITGANRFRAGAVDGHTTAARHIGSDLAAVEGTVRAGEDKIENNNYFRPHIKLIAIRATLARITVPSR